MPGNIDANRERKNAMLKFRPLLLHNNTRRTSMFAVSRSLVRRTPLLFAALAVGIGLLLIGVIGRAQKPGPGNGRADDTSSPIFGVKIPDGYRQWELISVSENADKNELKGMLGNAASMKAYRD